MGQGPAHKRRQNRGEQPRPDQIRRRPQQVFLLRPAKHHQSAHRDHHGAARALQHTAQGQHGEVLTQGTQQRRDRKHGYGQAEDPAGPEAFGKPAAERNPHRDSHEVGRHGDVHVGGGHREIVRDAGNRRDEDSSVQKFHEKSCRDKEGQPWTPLVGSGPAPAPAIAEPAELSCMETSCHPDIVGALVVRLPDDAGRDAGTPGRRAAAAIPSADSGGIGGAMFLGYAKGPGPGPGPNAETGGFEPPVELCPTLH